MILIGIDPGVSGAVAVYDEETLELADVFDVPAATVGGKNRIDAYAFADKVSDFGSRVRRVTIERVGSMPKQGVSSSFAFGCSYGIAIGIVAALGYPIEYVTPMKWKSRMGIPIGSDKQASRARASQVFGGEAGAKFWPNKGHHGRAEAALLALYGAQHG